MASLARSSTGSYKDSRKRERIRAVVLHSTVPGRVRYRLDSLYRNSLLAGHLKSYLIGLQGVTRVSPNIFTGHLLVFYDPQVTRLSLLSRAIQQFMNRFELSKATVLGTDFEGDSAPQLMSSLQVPGLHGSDEWDRMSPSQVIRRLQTSEERGLTASQVNQRLGRFGFNQLPSMEARSQISIFLDQLSNLPTVLLLGSSAVSLLTGGVADAAVILGVTLVNGWIGYVTESHAEKTISSLITGKPQKVKVLRSGQEAQVFPEQITRGDILILVPGVTAAADARIIASRNLTIDESILTGESVPVTKTSETQSKFNRQKRNGHGKERISILDAPNLIFRGTQITGGSGYAVVYSIGAETQIGKIQSLMGSRSPPETPLQTQLELLGRQMAVLSLTSSVIVSLLAALRGHPFREIWRLSVSLAVAAIPESLPTIATTTLARGVRRLNDKGVLVRYLGAVETMGNVDLVCLDKTGTLTLNQMTVVEVMTLKERIRLSPEGFFKGPVAGETPHSFTLRRLLQVVTLCNEAEFRPERPNGGLFAAPENFKGSSTESALLRSVVLLGMNPNQIRSRFPLLEIRYRTERKGYMVSLHRRPGKTPEYLMAIKGRPDQVLSLCSYYLSERKRVKLSKAMRRRILQMNSSLAHQGLRVLGVAYKNTDAMDSSASELVWLGLAGLADPLRAGMRSTIRHLHRAGIRTTMITGDQKETAAFIGKQLGLSDEVFSRVSPSDKLGIVENLQKSGHVVAMIGDGINDGPALKIADVGIAMGETGAEVATRVADIVLQNDELEKIMIVLSEGRTVRDDIHKAVDYILTQNLAELLFTFVTLFVGTGQLLSPMQILWMNLVTDIFPELALAQEPPAKDILSRPPVRDARSKSEFLQGTQPKRIVFEASTLAGAALAGNIYGRLKYGPGVQAKTLSFLSLVTSSLLYSFSCRSEKPIYSYSQHLSPNPYLPLSVGLGLAMEGLGIAVPRIRQLLGSSPVSAGDLLRVGGISLIPLILIEIGKISAEVNKENSYGIV